MKKTTRFLTALAIASSAVAAGSLIAISGCKKNNPQPQPTSLEHVCRLEISDATTLSVQIWTTKGAEKIMPDLWYSTNKGENWTQITKDTKSVDFAKDTTLYLAGNNPNGFSTKNMHVNLQLVTPNPEGSIKLGGSVMSLVGDYKGETTTIPSDSCFAHLFNITESVAGKYPAIKSVESGFLPATTLTPECYLQTFHGCKNLKTIGKGLLPATELTIGCYREMFMGTSVEEIPDGLLPARETAVSCYEGMFMQANVLKLPKNLLPANNLDKDCYSNMFNGNRKLEEIPEGFLPATNLGYSCYIGMFANCDSLWIIPDNLLPATQMQPFCYYGMFQKCPSIVHVGENFLPGTSLAEACYKQMFMDCTELKEIPKLPAKEMAPFCYKDLFMSCQRVQKTPDLSHVTKLDESCFEAMFNGTSITSFAKLDTTLELKKCCFMDMYGGCKKIEDKKLPEIVTTATTLADGCYLGMFNNVDFVSDIADKMEQFTFPATNPVQQCYKSMFFNSNITTLPIFKLTNVTFETFFETFKCTKIKQIPDGWKLPLPTNDEESIECYSRMFEGCYELVQIPTNLWVGTMDILPTSACSYMFCNCLSLGNMCIIDAKEIGPEACHDMFKSCNGLATGSLTKAMFPATKVGIEGYEQMFQDCDGLMSLKSDLLSNITSISYQSFDGMFSFCSELTQAPLVFNASLTNVPESCMENMFYKCEKLTVPPKLLNFTTFDERACRNMFGGCKALTASTDTSETKFFVCPETFGTDAFTDMFNDTNSPSSEPIPGQTYYYG